MIYTDEQFMLRCFDLARNGEGKTAPNPMVGAVIVHNGRIIGEGYHTKFGAPHAEVMAIQSVLNKTLLTQSTLYVNLEPCCHHGKTPPCTQLIIDMGIPKVVIAATDPFAKVNGGGIDVLQKNGIDVTVGVLKNKARELNRFFYTYHEKRRPYVILKWAQSIDGYIDSDRSTTSQPTAISSPTSHTLVHRWRTQVQAIMVGANTVLADNPQLTARNWQGNHPLRVIIDPNGRINNNCQVFNNDADTLLFVSRKSNQNYGKRTTQIEINFDENVEQNILNKLYQYNIQSVFIEGGAYTINQFIIKNQWDEARVFISNPHIGAGVKAPQMPTRPPIALSIIEKDELFLFRQNNS